MCSLEWYKTWNELQLVVYYWWIWCEWQVVPPSCQQTPLQRDVSVRDNRIRLKSACESVKKDYIIIYIAAFFIWALILDSGGDVSVWKYDSIYYSFSARWYPWPTSVTIVILTLQSNRISWTENKIGHQKLTSGGGEGLAVREQWNQRYIWSLLVFI